MKVWGPLSTVKGSFLLMFSSPDNDNPNHWFGQIIMEPHLYPSIAVKSFSQICDECQKLETSEMMKCNHVKINKSRLKEGSGDDLAQILRKRSEDESLGIVKKNESNYFKKSQVDPLFIKENFVDHEKPKFYIISVDSNYGGANDTALSIGYILNGLYVICWLSIENTKCIEDVYNFFLSNISKFRSHINDTLTPIAIAYESQARWDGSDMRNLINKQHSVAYRNIYFIKENFRNKKKDYESRSVCGVNINKSRMNKYVTFFNKGLLISNIRLSKNIGTINKEGINEVLISLKDMILRFRHFDENMNYLYRQSGVKKMKNNSAKEIKDGVVINDDLLITVFMTIFFLDSLEYDVEYSWQKNELFQN